MTNTHTRDLRLVRLGSARDLIQALMVGIRQEPLNPSFYYMA
jgi:hypothetical protein